MVKSISADRVIDCIRKEYTESKQSYNLIVDMVGNHSPLANTKVLNSEGTLVIVGGPKGNWLAPFTRSIQAMILSLFVGQELIMFVAQTTKNDLAFLSDLMQSGKVTPVIDRRYKLSEVPEAIRYSKKGHARGKIMIVIDTENE